MAVARCFDSLSNALKAVKYGNPSQVALILRSVKSDATQMQNDLRNYQQKLQKAEGQYEEAANRLTGEMNQLYQREQAMRKEERELIGLEEQLRSQNKRNVESLEEAERRLEQTKEEEQRLRNRRWGNRILMVVSPLAGGIKELIENNGEKARQARVDMERYRRRIEEEHDDIRRTNSQISGIQTKINEVQRKTQSLKKKRDSCHEKLGAVKSTTAFVLEAIKVSREIINLTDSATVKTENLEKVMLLASKKNTLKVLKSGGTKTKVASFKENWDEIVDMMQSSSLLRLEEELYLLE